MRVCVECGSRLPADVWSCPSCRFAPAFIGDVATFAPALAPANVNDADYLHADLAAAESTHFWFTARNLLIAWAIRSYFPEARSFFDVGCGTGGVLAAIAEALPQLQLTAADALIGGLRIARQRVAGATIVQLDVNRMPYDQEFDIVGAFDVLEHLDDDRHALNEMHRTVTPGGGIVVTVPQHPGLWSAVDEYSHHRRRYTRSELLRKVTAAGFTIERVTSFMTLLLPVLALQRRRKRDHRALDPAAELRIGHPLNRLLTVVCSIERRAIQAGAYLPVGGSLLLVAKRRP